MASARPKIYLNKIHLKEYKSIEDLKVDFQKGLNILIGKNGAGKSNFLDFVNRILTRRYQAFYNYANIEFVSSDDHLFVVELQKSIQSIKEGSVEDRIGVDEKFTIDSKLLFDSSKPEKYKDSFVFNGNKINYLRTVTLRSLFSRLGYLSIYPLFIQYALPEISKLECLSVPGTLRININSEFSSWDYPNTINSIERIFKNIELVHADSVKQIRSTNKANFYKRLEFDDDLIDNLKRYSNIQEIRFNNNLNVYHEEKSVIIENIKVDFKVNGNWLPWSQLSDGTQRLFYIISEISISNGPILIEEPELGVHPHQFSLLMDFLKEQSENKQIVISTHSPKALDHLSPDELNSILITSYSKKNGTEIRHLSLKEITKAKKYMKEVGFFSDYWLLSDLE